MPCCILESSENLLNLQSLGRTRVGFLLLLQHITAGSMALSNANSLSYGSGDHKSAMVSLDEVLAGLYSFLEALGENSFPCLFQSLEAVCIPWLVAPFSIFKASNVD